MDEDGLVTAKGPGVTTITADVGGKTAELIVRCSFEDTAEGGYHLSLTDVTLSVGEASTCGCSMRTTSASRAQATV